MFLFKDIVEQPAFKPFFAIPSEIESDFVY